MNVIANIISAGWIFIRSYIKWTIIIWFIIFAIGFSLAEASEQNPPVKKSNSEICHAEDSSYYNRTKNFTAYETLEECLASSDKARLPKNYEMKDKS
tara:strand:+ start:940 stop:1230 length:291 start_codon:yes stop_codon:yes gene_type:complete